MTEIRQSRDGSRPPRWEEALASRLFRLLAPRLGRPADPTPPSSLQPWQSVDIPRPTPAGPLSGTWFPAAGAARGAVLLVPPWQRRGRAYFHRRGRLQALRAAGYHSLTVDLSNIGARTAPTGFYDRDVRAALDYLADRCPGLPLFFWGVSNGGYWGHVALAGDRRVLGAMFEDVSPHLLQWSWRTTPWGRPFYLFFRHVLRRSYRFLDARRHAASWTLRRATYVAGTRDAGIPVTDSRQLAAVRDHHLHLVSGARHLESIKRARARVIELALATFSDACSDAQPDAGRSPCSDSQATISGPASVQTA